MDEYEINIPDLKSNNALLFCNNSYEFRTNNKVVLNFNNTITFEPFAMLLISSKIRSIISENSSCKFYIKGHDNNTYAKHMGFFQSMRFDVGKRPGEAIGSETYIPMTKISFKDIRIESYENGCVPCQQVIEDKAHEMANVLLPNNVNAARIVGYSLREIMRNSLEHSDSESVWIAAQKWEYKGRVEVAILDEGVGVKQAIDVNPNITLANNRDALRLAIEPGISGKAFKYKGVDRGQSSDGWGNSGYGLYVTSELCRRFGEFIICSGEAALNLKSNRRSIDLQCNFSGTATMLSLNTSNLDKVDNNLLHKIVEEGEVIARKNKGFDTILSASKVSRTLKNQ